MRLGDNCLLAASLATSTLPCIPLCFVAGVDDVPTSYGCRSTPLAAEIVAVDTDWYCCRSYTNKNGMGTIEAGRACCAAAMAERNRGRIATSDIRTVKATWLRGVRSIEDTWRNLVGAKGQRIF